MKILAIGDVVGSSGIDHLTKNLSAFADANKVDLVIANGENATEIKGICAADAERLYHSGVDFITLGNHAFGKRDIYSFLDSNDHRIIRPANYSAAAPGAGYALINVDGYRILIINVLGGMFSAFPINSPFEAVERILSREEGRYDFAIMDIHAEATSEKLALAHCFDGRIEIMFGTHTHVQTADEQILPKGSAYITDIGMTGPVNSILGTNIEAVIEKFTHQTPQLFTVAEGVSSASGVIFDIDPGSQRIRTVKRVKF